MVQMLFVRLVVVWMMVWMVDTSDCRVALAAEITLSKCDLDLKICLAIVLSKFLLSL